MQKDIRNKNPPENKLVLLEKCERERVKSLTLAKKHTFPVIMREAIQKCLDAEEQRFIVCETIT